MFLAGDIGGTRSRFYAVENDKVIFEHVFSSREYKNFVSIIEAFLKLSGMHFTKCVFGIAGVVSDGRCKTTNLPWEVSIEEIKNVLGVEEGYLINDLALLTYGIIGIDSHFLETMQPGEKKEGPMLLICPGTGLGVAMATHTKIPYEIYPSEAGHVDFAPVTKEELKLLEFYIPKFEHVSVERFVSGSGLTNIYQFLCHEHKKIPQYQTSEEITEAALTANDEIAVRTCLMFLEMLASTVGNFCLNYLPRKGVYLCGNLMRRLLPLMNKEHFLSRMSAKGRFVNLLKKFPIYLVKEQQLAVKGALLFFKNHTGEKR